MQSVRESVCGREREARGVMKRAPDTDTDVTVEIYDIKAASNHAHGPK